MSSQREPEMNGCRERLGWSKCEESRIGKGKESESSRRKIKGKSQRNAGLTGKEKG